MRDVCPSLTSRLTVVVLCCCCFAFLALCLYLGDQSCHVLIYLAIIAVLFSQHNPECCLQLTTGLGK